jgi:hypothetical protein
MSLQYEILENTNDKLSLKGRMAIITNTNKFFVSQTDTVQETDPAPDEVPKQTLQFILETFVMGCLLGARLRAGIARG